MAPETNKSWMATGLLGTTPVGLLAAAGTLGSATANSVTFAGHDLNWPCAFKAAFGIPCPGCGMTRSLLLTLHGQFQDAFTLNPGGPAMVCGAVLIAVALGYLAYVQHGQDAAAFQLTQRRIVLGAALYGGLTAALIFGHWIYAVS